MSAADFAVDKKSPAGVGIQAAAPQNTIAQDVAARLALDMPPPPPASTPPPYDISTASVASVSGTKRTPSLETDTRAKKSCILDIASVASAGTAITSQGATAAPPGKQALSDVMLSSRDVWGESSDDDESDNSDEERASAPLGCQIPDKQAQNIYL